MGEPHKKKKTDCRGAKPPSGSPWNTGTGIRSGSSPALRFSRKKQGIWKNMAK